ncbi:MAG: GTPase ObgE [Acidobacteriota bacterium]|jgi:GTP-binding protein
MFIDEAKIYVQGGRGGNGCIAFRREKFVPRGGPSGGDGGDGGAVILRTTAGMSTLAAFRRKQHFRAARGAHGEGSRRHGRQGADLVVDVPPGTAVLTDDRSQILADLVRDGETWVAARGGQGGRGNARFATSTRQAPRIAEDGTTGEERWLRLELRVLADVGLVGLPNAGKSSLIARISAARPRIADYPFTTTSPVLGVVEMDLDTSFVVADIPGLIEGAHRGQGLGHRFLRHLRRTRVLVHVVDPCPTSGHDPAEDLGVIEQELREYSADLVARPRLVALNKMDLGPDPALVARLRRRVEAAGRTCVEVSAASGQGLDRLVREMARILREAPPAPDPAGEPE